MSTETNNAVIVITAADSKVVTSIKSYVSALDKVEGGYNNIAKETGKVAARMGLQTPAQVSDLLRLSYYEAEGSVTEAEKLATLNQYKSDISNLTTLVMPSPIKEGKGKDTVIKVSSADLIAARDKAWEYNDKLPKGGRRNLRIGQKTVLAIVRGQTTVDYEIGIKNGTIKPKVEEKKSEGSAGASGATTASESDTSEGGANSPEQQAAQVPQPKDGEQPVIGNARDTLRAAIRNIQKVFVEQHNIPAADVKAIFEEEVAKF